MLIFEPFHHQEGSGMGLACGSQVSSTSTVARSPYAVVRGQGRSGTAFFGVPSSNHRGAILTTGVPRNGGAAPSPCPRTSLSLSIVDSCTKLCPEGQ